MTVTETKMWSESGQVAADEDNVRLAPGFLEAGEEFDDPIERGLARKPEAQDRVERASAHGGDVADVDVEALAAEEPGVVEREDEIVALDEEVLGHEESSRARPEDGRIVPDAEDHVLPGDGEVPADTDSSSLSPSLCNFMFAVRQDLG